MNRAEFISLAVLSAIFFSCYKPPTGESPLPPPAGPQPEEPVVPEDNDKPQPGQYALPLIETTDIHGHIVYSESGTLHYRLAYIADKVEDIRGRGDNYDKSRLLLLDGGDLYQGSSISNLQDGQPIYMAMDLMDYDAVTVGNHEFDWVFDTLVDSDATLPDYDRGGLHYMNEVPVVCSNLYRNGSRVSCTRDYVIVEKSAVNSAGATVPVKIGIIGFATNYAGSIMTSKFAGMGYSINADYSLAENLAASLESSGQCDATILLVHGAANSSAGNLGGGSVIDLVLGGHSHTTQSGRTSQGMPYLQGGRYAEHYAYARLCFTVDDEGAVSFSGVDSQNIFTVDSTRDLHSTQGQNADDLSETVLSLSDEAVANVADELNDVIGYIDVSATTYYISGSGDRAATMSNWMCDIIRRIGDADVAFVNSGGIRTTFPLNGQSRRDITVANVYDMFPFCNTTYVYDITYAELLKVFTYALTSGGSALFSRVSGIDCYYNGGTVRSLRKDGTVIYQNGSWTGNWAARNVLLAVSEYIATTERTYYYTDIPNPLIEWNSTPRLINNTMVDNENAIRVLREEAEASGGRLKIDTAAHFIESN